MLQRALYSGHVVISCYSFNSLQVRNIQYLMSLYFKISFTFAETESNSTINAHIARVMEGLLQKQSVRPLYIFTGSLTKSHSERGCQNLCMLIIQRTLLKRYVEFPQDEFLIMLRHGEHISVYVEHFFESCLLKSEIHANYSLCCSCF